MQKEISNQCVMHTALIYKCLQFGEKKQKIG